MIMYVPLVEQYQEQLTDNIRQLALFYEDLAVLDLEDGDELVVSHSRLERLWFNCLHRVKKLLSVHSSCAAKVSTPDNKGVKLLKLDVPTFDGDVLHWKQFWEQFVCP